MRHAIIDSETKILLEDSMRYFRSFVTTLVVVCSLPLIATPPPQQPPALPPQLTLLPPPALPPLRSVGPALPMTASHIRSLAVSATTENALLAAYAPQTTASTAAAATTSESSVPLHYSRRYVPTTATTPLQPYYALVWDAPPAREQETTLIINSIYNQGVDRTIHASMRYPGEQATNPVVYIKTDFAAAFAAPTRYSYSGDPALAQNPYHFFGPNGSGDRMYLCATDFSLGKEQSQLDVFYTSDGGLNFMGPTKLWEGGHKPPDNHIWFADKPAIAVSWGNTTRGIVYVAAIGVDLSSNTDLNPNHILVFRSDDGGVTFLPTADLVFQAQYPAVAIPTRAPQAPQIVVDSANGNVFLVWLDWSTDKIYGAWAGPSATSFQVLSTEIGAGTFLKPGADVLGGSSDPNVQARSVLVARYNAGSHRVFVVWHARQTPSTVDADIFLAMLDTSTFTFTKRATPVNTGLANDQWNPAVDTGLGGEVLVTFYDRRRDGLNRNYQLWSKKLNSTGVDIDALDTEITVGGSSSPWSAPLLLGGFYGTLGEYQDVWFWRDWTSSYIFAPGGTVGVYTSHTVR